MIRRLLPVVLAILALGVGAGAAHAGTWIQVSCVNPNGSAAPSEGWTAGSSGGGGPVVSAQCTPSSPMVAELSSLVAAPAGAEAHLVYRPPAGSTLSGGTVEGTLSASGTGSSFHSTADAGLYEPDFGSEFKACDTLFPCNGSSDTLSGQFSLPSDRHGYLGVQAKCGSGDGTPCNLNAQNGTWAVARIARADLVLTSNVSPQGTGFSGSGLDRRVRGTGHIVFTASESEGPGIYWVGVALDGRTVWGGTPNTNGGTCVPVGSSGAAFMFDYQQPCLTSEGVDVPVPTTGLPDGAHELAITVIDAAGNVSPVLDQTITTSNPQRTPIPKHGLRARFVISWSWLGATTRLRSITVSHLPRGSGVTASCTGRKCPRLKLRHVNAPHVARLLHSLAGRRFHVGDVLHLTVSARHRHPERILLAFRSGRKPSARLKR